MGVFSRYFIYRTDNSYYRQQKLYIVTKVIFTIDSLSLSVTLKSWKIAEKHTQYKYYELKQNSFSCKKKPEVVFEMYSVFG